MSINCSFALGALTALVLSPVLFAVLDFIVDDLPRWLASWWSEQ